jgi:hypothetical protein
MFGPFDHIGRLAAFGKRTAYLLVDTWPTL